ncbi:hypothetical protein B0I35DRAFT_212198 [Stachybotrys elegans]|uniref:Uncharacterized protein n=1 Tax=Stachybotrys elegans TaxID=80388 RepID=A0A8K0WSI9_9HYPO|nr:hypothetical protein B0I35DRAFT_212198 [Stachybotrys elegans]
MLLPFVKPKLLLLLVYTTEIQYRQITKFLDSHSIKHLISDGSRVDEPLPKVIVTSSTSINSSQWAMTLDASTTYVVVYGCHSALSNDSPLRQMATRLCAIACHRFWVSGLLSHNDRCMMLSRLGLCLDSTSIVNRPLDRPDLRMSWKMCSDPGAYPSMAAPLADSLLKPTLAEPFTTTRAIVYCQTNQICKQVAEANAWICHGISDDAKTCESQLAQWLEPSPGCAKIIATSAPLNHDAPLPAVSAVMVIGQPASLTCLVEHFATASRGDTSPVDAVMISGWLQSPMNVFTDRQCRRRSLDAYFGIPSPFKGCSNSEQPCDVCTHQFSKASFDNVSLSQTWLPPSSSTESVSTAPSLASPMAGSIPSSHSLFTPSTPASYSTPSSSPALPRWTKATPRRDPLQTKIEDFLNKRVADPDCPLCRFVYRKGDQRHRLNECREPHAQEINQNYDEIVKWRRYYVKLVDYTACFACWCPQDMCPGMGDKSNCTLKFHFQEMTAILFTIYRDVLEDVAQEMTGRHISFIQQGDTPFGTNEADSWLREMTRWKGMQTMNMFWLVATTLERLDMM